MHVAVYQQSSMQEQRQRYKNGNLTRELVDEWQEPFSLKLFRWSFTYIYMTFYLYMIRVTMSIYIMCMVYTHAPLSSVPTFYKIWCNKCKIAKSINILRAEVWKRWSFNSTTLTGLQRYKTVLNNLSIHKSAITIVVESHHPSTCWPSQSER